mgnify:CR=1 FL=1
MKSIITSVSPYLCEKIASGDCKILVKKSTPKEVPFKAYVYVTKDKPYLYRVDDDNNFELTNTLHPKTYEYVKDYNEQNGKVIGEFVCDKVYLIKNQGNRFVVANEEQGVTNEIARQSCLDYDDMVNYLGNNGGYGWHITALKIYDKPKELSEFKTPPCEKSEKACEKCKYLVVINTPDMYEVDCFVENGREISRPPQSYMFVEEVVR